MENLIEIQAQIEILKKQADVIRSNDFASTVADIRAKMAAFGITVKDLQAQARKGGRRTRASTPLKTKTTKTARGPKSGAKLAAKFRGPSGETWTGRGLTPKWLAALISQGHRKEEYSVQAASPTA